MSLLWRVSSPSATKESFLFGTIHLSHKHFSVLLNSVMPYLESSDKVTIEVSHDVRDVQMISEFITLPNQGHISDIISDKKWIKYKTVFDRSFNFPLENYDQYIPIVITNILSEGITSVGKTEVMDFYLQQKAIGLGKEIVGLETAIEHYSVLKKIDLKFQIRQMDRIAENPPLLRKRIRQALRLYSDERVNELYQSTKSNLGRYRKIMLYERNNNFVTRIEEMMKTGKSVFSTFGAAHLGGNYGVIALLKRKGFKVEPIKISQR